MSNDKVREEFEKWRLREFCGGAERLKKCSNAPETYYYTAENEAWKAWKASRAALVVELPGRADDFLYGRSWNKALDCCGAAIEAAGVRVKP